MATVDKKKENQRDKDLMRSLARAQVALVDALGNPDLRDSLVADLKADSDSPFAELLPDVRTLTLQAANEVHSLGRDFRLVDEGAANWAVGALVRLISSKKEEWTVNFTSGQRRCFPPSKCMHPPFKPAPAKRKKGGARKLK